MKVTDRNRWIDKERERERKLRNSFHVQSLMFNLNFSLQVCAVRATEMVEVITQGLRFYSELHNKKLNERKQTLITRNINPRTPNESVPGTSAEGPSPGPFTADQPPVPPTEDLTKEEMEEFEGFLVEDRPPNRRGFR